MPAATVSNKCRLRADKASNKTGWCLTSDADRIVPALAATSSAAMMPSRVPRRTLPTGPSGARSAAVSMPRGYGTGDRRRRAVDQGCDVVVVPPGAVVVVVVDVGLLATK